MLVLTLTACQLSSGGDPSGVPRTAETGTVVSVFDGDSLEVIGESGDAIELRLAGVNAPEADECGHDESRDYLENSVDGRRVIYEVLATDQFGRSLAHIWADGRHLNHDLVARGHAIATTPDPDDPYGEGLVGAETTAAGDDLGIWADDACGRSDPLPEVRIAEVRADPPGRDEDDLGSELVTLVNEGDNDVDLGGWKLRDESSRHRFTFPPGTTLLAGRTITVNSADPGWRPGDTPVWNNGGDLVLILDQSGRIIDHNRY